MAFEHFPISDSHHVWVHSDTLDHPWPLGSENSDRILPQMQSHLFLNPGSLRHQGTQPFSNVAIAWQKRLDPTEISYTLAGRLRTAPYYDGSPSMYTSSSQSDRQSPPMASPEASNMPYSPELEHDEHLFPNEGACDNKSDYATLSSNTCVTMECLQRYADTQPGVLFEEEDNGCDALQPQEGFVPMQYPRGSHDHDHLEIEQPVTESMRSCEQQIDLSFPFKRRRRAPNQRTVTTTSPPIRVAKRLGSCRSPPNTLKSEPNPSQPQGLVLANQAFPCPLAHYGCKSAFGAKNEWKRHAFTQHFQLSYWRCDECSQISKKPNDFNRKDLFVQHVRRMHATSHASMSVSSKKSRAKVAKDETVEEALKKAAKRCHHRLRSPPTASRCIFCKEHFSGEDSFDARMEHIGRHMENAKKAGEELEAPSEWQVDEETERWMLEKKLLIAEGGELKLADGTC